MTATEIEVLTAAYCARRAGMHTASRTAIRALNGTELAGLALKVSEARPKTEGGPAGFRREGGGRRRGPWG
jgi:hypothetical protein